VAPAGTDVGAGIPLVNERDPPDVAPGKAGSVAVPAIAVVLAGLRTLAKISSGKRIDENDSLIDDMDNTLLDKDVGSNDSGAVDIYRAIVHSDFQSLVCQRWNSGVGQVGGVKNHVWNQVISQNLLEVVQGDVGKDVGDALEGVVVGNESCEIGWQRATGDIGLAQSTSCSGVVEWHNSCGDVLWDGKESVDDVDGAAGEVVVLSMSA
jgi:hypothetical protein